MHRPSRGLNPDSCPRSVLCLADSLASRAVREWDVGKEAMQEDLPGDRPARPPRLPVPLYQPRPRERCAPQRNGCSPRALRSGKHASALWHADLVLHLHLPDPPLFHEAIPAPPPGALSDSLRVCLNKRDAVWWGCTKQQCIQGMTQRGHACFADQLRWRRRRRLRRASRLAPSRRRPRRRAAAAPCARPRGSWRTASGRPPRQWWTRRQATATGEVQPAPGLVSSWRLCTSCGLVSRLRAPGAALASCGLASRPSCSSYGGSRAVATGLSGCEPLRKLYVYQPSINGMFSSIRTT